MTTIYCSKKFSDFIGKEKVASPVEFFESELGDWNGHLFYYQRKKHLIFTNSKTYYALILPPVRKVDLQDFENIFIERLLHQLAFDKVIGNTETLVLLQRLLPIQLSRTNNDKKAIGTLNEFIFQFKVQCEYLDQTAQDLSLINNILNNILVGAGRVKKGDYGRPVEDMKALISAVLKS